MHGKAGFAVVGLALGALFTALLAGCGAQVTMSKTSGNTPTNTNTTGGSVYAGRYEGKLSQLGDSIPTAYLFVQVQSNGQAAVTAEFIQTGELTGSGAVASDGTVSVTLQKEQNTLAISGSLATGQGQWTLATPSSSYTGTWTVALMTVNSTYAGTWSGASTPSSGTNQAITITINNDGSATVVTVQGTLHGYMNSADGVLIADAGAPTATNIVAVVGIDTTSTPVLGRGGLYMGGAQFSTVVVQQVF